MSDNEDVGSARIFVLGALVVTGAFACNSLVGLDEGLPRTGAGGATSTSTSVSSSSGSTSTSSSTGSSSVGVSSSASGASSSGATCTGGTSVVTGKCPDTACETNEKQAFLASLQAPIATADFALLANMTPAMAGPVPSGEYAACCGFDVGFAGTDKMGEPIWHDGYGNVIGLTGLCTAGNCVGAPGVLLTFSPPVRGIAIVFSAAPEVTLFDPSMNAIQEHPMASTLGFFGYLSSTPIAAMSVIGAQTADLYRIWTSVCQ